MSTIETTGGDYTIAALGTGFLVADANGTIYLESADVVITGNLIVEGSITSTGGSNPNFESNLLTINDISSPDDATAESGGLLLLGDTDKSLRWYNATNAWTSDVNFDLSDPASAYHINGTLVLDATSLGDGIIVDGGSF